MSSKDKCISLMIWSVLIELCLFQPKYCLGIYAITRSQPLFRGETLLSPRQIFELGFFSPPNSSNQYIGIWYKGISPLTVVWVANRENPINGTDSEASLTIGNRGNLELLDSGNNRTIWSTIPKSLSNASTVSAALLDNGNFVLEDRESGNQLWKSFNYPVDVFLPGSVIGFNSKTGDKFSLTSWKTKSDPSPGKLSLVMSSQKPPQAFLLVNGTIPYWRSGPWDKSRFTGIPAMDTDYGSEFNVVTNLDDGTTLLRYDLDYNSTIGFMSLGESLKHIFRRENHWFVGWEAPKRPCDVFGVCGPFGFCSDFKSPICECLKGFMPKSSSEWSQENWTGGCVRRRELLCHKIKSSSNSSSKIGERDVFLNISNVKPPDFYELGDVENSDYDTCESLCTHNCSCLAYADIKGIGCLVWAQGLVDIQNFSVGGEEIFVRLAHEELVHEQGGGNRNKKILISLLVIFSFGIIGAIIFRLLRRRTILITGNVLETVEHNSVTEPRDGPRSDGFQATKHDRAELPIFEFGAILAATNNFSPENKLGQGGFGPVYKGSMVDGTEIAVKRLSSSSGQGVEEFKNEMKLISKLQHRNLVRLLGYSVENEEKLLVYEFMPNKSLDYFIFDQRLSAKLDWASRWNIINGIARGLVYLHRDSCLRVIHRDLKLSNILLDEKMNPKISDFGLARIFQGTLDLGNTQRVVGTLGYMSPEYAMSGIFSEKSDVFSFGVLVLEIVSGKKNTNFHYRDQQLSLIAYAWHFRNAQEQDMNLVDEALAGSYSSQEVMRSVHVGLLCTQDYADNRPSMLDVVLMLSKETDLPEPKRPLFALQSLPKFNFSDTRFSGDETTMSLIEGR